MSEKIIQAASLALVLFVTWLLLSGVYDSWLLLGLGVASVLVVVLISWRMGILDPEGQPTHLGARALRYWPWLLWEIAKANIDVARRTLSPGPGISPTLVRVPTRLNSDLGRVIYANSITLTPGTISVDVDQDSILVHALSREGASDVESGEMERRVASFVAQDDSR